MYSKIYLLISIFVTASIIPKVTFCQESDLHWIYVGKSADYITFYIKNEYISMDYNNIIKMWVKLERPTATIGKKIYKNVVEEELYLLDCKNKKYELLSFYTYSADGKIIDSNDDNTNGTFGFSDVVPESIMELVINKVAETFNVPKN